jgi:hypothetical protein
MLKPMKLKPCPFCNSPAYVRTLRGESFWSRETVNFYQVACSNDECEAQTAQSCEHLEPAVEKWNTRGGKIDKNYQNE